MFNMKSLIDLHPICFSVVVGESDVLLELSLVVINVIDEDHVKDEPDEDGEDEPPVAVVGESCIEADECCDDSNNQEEPLGVADFVRVTLVNIVLAEPDSDDKEWRVEDDVDPAPERTEVVEVNEEPLGVVVDLWVSLEPDKEEPLEDGEDLMD